MVVTPVYGSGRGDQTEPKPSCIFDPGYPVHATVFREMNQPLIISLAHESCPLPGSGFYCL
jgi:hypothetical protein